MAIPGVNEPRPLAELWSFAAGDVLAARGLAEKLLRKQRRSEAGHRDARLIMTAACLHLHSQAARTPTVTDLLALLLVFTSHTNAQTLLGSSPMQFLQFAGAEIDGLSAKSRKHALEICVRACASVDP